MRKTHRERKIKGEKERNRERNKEKERGRTRDGSRKRERGEENGSKINKYQRRRKEKKYDMKD